MDLESFLKNYRTFWSNQLPDIGDHIGLVIPDESLLFAWHHLGIYNGFMLQKFVDTLGTDENKFCDSFCAAFEKPFFHTTDATACTTHCNKLLENSDIFVYGPFFPGLLQALVSGEDEKVALFMELCDYSGGSPVPCHQNTPVTTWCYWGSMDYPQTPDLIIPDSEIKYMAFLQDAIKNHLTPFNHLDLSKTQRKHLGTSYSTKPLVVAITAADDSDTVLFEFPTHPLIVTQSSLNLLNDSSIFSEDDGKEVVVPESVRDVGCYDEKTLLSCAPNTYLQGQCFRFPLHSCIVSGFVLDGTRVVETDELDCFKDAQQRNSIELVAGCVLDTREPLLLLSYHNALGFSPAEFVGRTAFFRKSMPNTMYTPPGATACVLSYGDLVSEEEDGHEDIEKEYLKLGRFYYLIEEDGTQTLTSPGYNISIRNVFGACTTNDLDTSTNLAHTITQLTNRIMCNVNPSDIVDPLLYTLSDASKRERNITYKSVFLSNGLYIRKAECTSEDSLCPGKPLNLLKPDNTFFGRRKDITFRSTKHDSDMLLTRFDDVSGNVQEYDCKVGDAFCNEYFNPIMSVTSEMCPDYTKYFANDLVTEPIGVGNLKLRLAEENVVKSDGVDPVKDPPTSVKLTPKDDEATNVWPMVIIGLVLGALGVGLLIYWFYFRTT